MKRESKNTCSFSSWHQLTCNCSLRASPHTLNREENLLLTKGQKKGKKVPHQLALHNFSLMFHLDLFHASCSLGKVSEVLTVRPLPPSANRCVGKAQISSWSSAGSINNLFVLIHQVCGCRSRRLCSMWGPNISWVSAALWCISPVRSTTGLLCQASATHPSRLNTVQPLSLGKTPPALPFTPFTSFPTQIYWRDLFMRSSEKWSEAQRDTF